MIHTGKKMDRVALGKSFIGVLIIGFIAFFPQTLFGQIQVNSVLTTVSDCPNNGTITVNAQTSSPPLLYSIIVGPVTQAQQTGAVFNALPPGSYTLKITDALGNSSSQTATITGTYKPIVFSPVPTLPTCNKAGDGTITGNLQLNTGKAPFSWELVSPSPIIIGPQSSNKFANLNPGNYSVRVKDACGSVSTIVSTIGEHKNNMLYNSISSVKVGCDSMMVIVSVEEKPMRMPYHFKYVTTNGSTYKPAEVTMLDTSYIKSGIIRAGYIVPKVTYGEMVYVTAYNSCGDSLLLPCVINPFVFQPRYAMAQCGQNGTVSFDNMNNGSFYDGVKPPLTYSFTDVASSAVIDAGSVSQVIVGGLYRDLVNSFSIKPQLEVGKKYKLTVRDGCGQVFEGNYALPSAKAKITEKRVLSFGACIDSVAGVARISFEGFSNPNLVFLSGPKVLGSTKPGYAYKDTYTYPIVLTTQIWSSYFEVSNLAIGKYKFKVYDDCGNEIIDSLTVLPSDVTSLGRRTSYKKGCPGKNAIYAQIPDGKEKGGATVMFYSLPDNKLLKYVYLRGGTFPQDRSDSVVNLTAGKYVVIYRFNNNYVYTIPLNNTQKCWSANDTVNIEDYKSPALTTSNAVMCHDKINIELLPDIKTGVPPYSYEIVSGPQVFPLQASNIFLLAKAGVYNARIYDMCGNASTKQVAVDSLALTFLPVSIVKKCDRVRYAYSAAPYYTYKWTTPGKITFISNDLEIDPITPADTGTYYVTRMVNINGCKDTLHTSYHVTLFNTQKIDSTICKGGAVKLGTSWYSRSGVYKEVFKDKAGCDSIVQLNLRVDDYKYGQAGRSLCQGTSIKIGKNTYSKEGTYRDTTATASCDSITIVVVSFYPSPGVNLGRDTSLCAGQPLVLNAGAGYTSYYWNGNYADGSKQSISVNAEGEYWLEVKDVNGCAAKDTIRILQIYALPIASLNKDTAICSGESIKLKAAGGRKFQWFPGGETGSIIIVNPLQTTTYKVHVGDEHQCGSSMAEVTVFVKERAVTPPFSKSLIIHCFDDGPLSIEPDWGTAFLWANTNETTKSISIDQPGTYTVKVFDSNKCAVEGQVSITGFCDTKLFVPSAFSPNNDGANDDLEIFGKNFTNFKIMIFNRWGEVIFISTDRNLRWDGTYRGDEMPIGTYPWKVSYQSLFDPEQKEIQEKGSVTLIR